jgi:general secretion pathway protein C
MLLLIQRHFKGLFLLLFALLGIAAGHFISTALGIYLVPSAREPGIVSEERAVTRQKPSLADFEIVLRRNIFDSTSPGAATLKSPQREPERVAPAAKTAAKADLKLLGTVSAEDGSLALIGAGRSMDLYRLGDDVPGGGNIREITRNLVTIQYRDGSVEVLSLYDTEPVKSPSSAGPPPSSEPAAENEKVKPVGNNQWVIDRGIAENARQNIGELLKSARMEPNLVNGNTEGFVVKMIQPGSLLADLGIRKGDVIMEVNGVELASPEKALQIFQQLREARHISIGLQRDGAPMNFEYEIN